MKTLLCLLLLALATPAPAASFKTNLTWIVIVDYLPSAPAKANGYWERLRNFLLS